MAATNQVLMLLVFSMQTRTCIFDYYVIHMYSGLGIKCPSFFL